MSGGSQYNSCPENSKNTENVGLHAKNIVIYGDSKVNFCWRGSHPSADPVTLRIYYNINDPIDYFIGRQLYLKELHHKIQNTVNKDRSGTVLSQSFVVPGLGGIGKTQTIRKYILQYSNKYDHIVWIDAETHHTAETQFVALASQNLNISKLDNHNQQKQLNQIVTEVYERLCKDDKLLLIVFDNAESLDNTEYHNDGIRCFLPQALSPLFRKPVIIITSRNREWLDQNVIKLGLWTEEESVQFIKHKIKIPHSPDEARDLAELFNQLPLSMHLVVAVINEEAQLKTFLCAYQYTITEFISDYKKGKINILEQALIKSQSDDEPIKMLLDVTFRKIKEREHGELALKILNILAYLSPTAVLKDLVFKITSANEKHFYYAMKLVQNYSLVEDYGSHLSIHRIVQDCAIRNAQLQECKQDDVVDLIFCNFRIHWSSLDVRSEINNIFVINVIHFTNKVISNFPIYKFLKHIEYIANQIQHFRFKEAEQYLRLVIECTDREFTIMPSQAGSNICKFIPSVYDAIGNCDNSKHLTTSTLTTQNNLAEVGEGLQSYSSERNNFPKVQEVQENKHEQNYFTTLGARNNLATVMERTGNYAEAEEMYRDILQVQEKVLGPENLSTLATKNNLAVVLERIGKYAEAKEIYSHVSLVQANLLGHEHPTTLATRNNVAVALERMGKYAEAIKIHQDVLLVQEKVLGLEDPSTLVTRRNLATVMERQGKYTEAEVIYKHVQEIEEKLHGGQHPLTLRTKHNLANVMTRIGKYAEAEEIYRNVLSDRENVLGPENPSTLITRRNLGIAMERMGKYTEAEMIYLSVLQIEEKVLGNKNPSTLRTRHNLANVKERLKKYAEAEDIYRDVLRLREKVLGHENPSTLITQRNLGIVMERMGKYTEAESIYMSVQQIEEKVLGHENPSTLRTRHNLASVKERLGKYAEAEEIYKDVLRLRERVIGHTNPSTLITRRNLRMLMGRMGKYKQSRYSTPMF